MTNNRGTHLQSTGNQTTTKLGINELLKQRRNKQAENRHGNDGQPSANLYRTTESISGRYKLRHKVSNRRSRSIVYRVSRCRWLNTYRHPFHGRHHSNTNHSSSSTAETGCQLAKTQITLCACCMTSAHCDYFNCAIKKSPYLITYLSTRLKIWLQHLPKFLKSLTKTRYNCSLITGT